MDEYSLPIRFDFTGENAMIQSAYITWRFAFEYDDGTLWNTAGYGAQMQVRKADDVQVGTFTDAGALSTGIGTSNGVQSNFRMTFSSTVFDNISDWGLARYDVYLIDLSARRYRVLEGYLTVSLAITRFT